VAEENEPTATIHEGDEVWKSRVIILKREKVVAE